MRESRTLLALALVLVAALCALLLAGPFAAALERGRARHHYREAFETQLERRHPERRLVVWMGDSTLWRQGDAIPYPRLVDRALGPEIETLLLRLPGLDAYHYYYLMGRALDEEPELVVLTANLRMFDPAGAARLNDLASHVPAGELTRALQLPLGQRGLTKPALLGAQLLHSGLVRHLYFVLDGLRGGPLPGAGAPRPKLADYAGPIDAASPVLQMLAAAVEMATRRGARVLVVVAPLPVARLEAAGLHDAEKFRAKIDLLRRSVEVRGGELFDLHDAISAEGFSDDSGHLVAAGHERAAGMLRRHVARALASGRQ